MLPVSVVLLAAGESTRMERQKALMPWQDAPTLLEYHLRELAAIDTVGEVIVVTGHESERITQIAGASSLARAVHNADYATGKVSSIIAGLRAVSGTANAIMLLAVDQPRPAAILRKIINSHDKSGASVTVPVHEGRRGHPVVFARRLLPDLLAISEETQGIRAVLERQKVHEVAIEDAAVLLDLNAPGDVAAASG